MSILSKKNVKIYEVGPRDGLQNEPGVIALERKAALIGKLAESGLRDIEVGSFVSPKWVPQMAGTGALMGMLPQVAGVRYSVLVPNMRGLEAFVQAVEGVAQAPSEIAVFVSASEGFSQANLNCSVAESLERLRPVVAGVLARGIAVRGYVSCVVECPFDGAIAPTQVAKVVRDLGGLGEMSISLGDTIGVARPEGIVAMLGAVLQEVDVSKVAGHYHDTGGLALANIVASLERGVRIFDSAVGGLGGCPYAPGAPGNVATEAVIARLAALGYETGIDPTVIAEAAAMAREMRNV